jgi:hypothetical protein
MAGELLHRAGAPRIERCEQNVCRNTCGPACRGLRRDLEQPDHARHPVDLARPDIAVPALVECSSASIPRTTGRGPKGPGRVPVERAAARGSLSSDRRRRAEAPQSPSHQALATCVRRGATRWRERPVAVASHRSPFDEGYITFSSSQQLAIVPEVRDTLLDAWGIELSRYSHRRPDISGTANVGSWPRSRLTSAWRAFRSSPLATLSTATALTSSPGRRCRCARPRPWPRRRRAASGALTGP